MDDSQLRIMIEAQNRASATLKQIERDVKKMSESAQKDMDKIKGSAGSGLLDGLKSALSTAGSAALSFAKKIGSIAWTQLKIGIAATTAAVIGLGTKGLMSAGQLQSLQISMNGLTGSMEAGSKAMATAYEYAQKAPFQLPDVAQTTKSLIAMGVEVKDTAAALETIGGIAITSGGAITDIGRIYGQVFATGKLQLEDMNQLTDNGVGIQKALEKQLGVSSEQVRKMATDGKISFEQFNTAMKGMVDPTILEQLNNTLPRQIDRLKGSVRQLSNAFVGVSVDAQNGFKMASDSVAQAATTFMKTLADAMRTDEIKNQFAEIGNSIVPGIQAVTAAITPMLNIITSLAAPIGTVFTGLASGVSALLQGAAPGMTSFFGVLNDSLKTLVPVITEVGSILGEALGTALIALQPALAPIAQVLATLAPVLAQIIGQVAVFAAQLISALAPILPPIATALADIVSALGKSLAPIMPVIVQAISQLAQAFITIITALAPVLPLLVQFAVDIISTVLVPLLPIVVQLVQMLAQVFTMVMAALMPILPPLMQLVMTLVQALAPILPVVATLFIQLIQALMPLLPPLLQLITILLPPMIQFLTIVANVATVLASVISGVVVGAMSGFIQILRFVVQWVSNVWSVVNGIAAIFSSAASAVYGAINGGFSRVMDFFRNLPGNILSALGNLGGMLSGAGRDMINGLVNALGGAKDAVVNKIKDIAAGALDAFKSFFGIKSPSRVMASMGDFMMQGLDRGLESMRSTVVATANSISSDVAEGFQADLTPGEMTAAGRLTGAAAAVAGGTTINRGGNTTSTTNQFSGQIILSTPQAVDAMFARLDRDGELAAMGVPT